MLRLDGKMSFETLDELTEDELLSLWDELVAYQEAKDKAMRAQMPSSPKR